jgi:putative ABC transport system substrate-binding protein
MMKRRDFMAVLGGAAAWPLAAHAQHRIVIGFLHSARPAPHLMSSFRQALAEAGYPDVSIEFRSAEGEYGRLPALAADLVRQQVSVIVTGGGDTSALAAKAATSTIPIVINVDRDPTTSGLVQSLNRPGGNITGVNQLVTELAAKCVEQLHNLMPDTAEISLLHNPNFQGSQDSIAHAQSAARAMGRGLRIVSASTATDLDAVFRSLNRDRKDALVVAPDPFFFSRREQIVALAAQRAIAVSYVRREFALAGGLMSYGTNLADAYRQVALYSARILKGEKPEHLPVVQSTKFELVINLKTAKALGLEVPARILAVADEVIE